MNSSFIKLEDVVAYSEDPKLSDCDNHALSYHARTVACAVFYELFLLGNPLLGNSMVR